jgi:hypothetical protein
LVRSPRITERTIQEFPLGDDSHWSAADFGASNSV